MKLSILYRTTQGPWGGGNSFLRLLKPAWESLGVEVVNDLQPDLDGVLINSSSLGAVGHNRNLTPDRARRAVQTGYLHPLPAWLGLSRWKGQRPPFVHRLDGVFRLYGRLAGDPADVAQLGVNRQMDWTVYQSKFCRESFEAEGLDVSRSDIIWNGIDIERFFPAEQLPPLKPFRLIAVAWSPNIRKGAPYVVEASKFPGVEVTFVGQWPANLDPGNVKIIPPVSHQELPKILRQHHAMLHMAQNDPCSNAILECMASGLPVIYHPSGGSPEIVKDCGVIGIPDLENAVHEMQERYDELRTYVLARRHELSIEDVARQYLDVFEQLGPVQL